MLKSAGLLWVGAFALAAVWWQLRIVAPIHSAHLGFPNYDLYSYYYPTVRFAFDEVHHGHLPVWNPYQLAGEPFFANQQHGLLYPVNALFWILPSQAAFRWTAVVHVGLALVFTGYLGRVVGLSTEAALLAALTFTFGFLPPLIYVRTWLNGAIWLPLEIALAIRLFRDASVRWVTVALAGVFVCQYVGGYPLYNVMGGYAIGFYVLWQWIALTRRGQWRTAWRGSVGVAAAALLACLMSAVQLLPMIEMTELSPRRLGSLAPAATDLFRTANLPHFLTLFVPSPLSRYVGAAVIPLALAGLFHPRLRAPAAFFTALWVAAALLAIGPTTPVYGLYQHLPTSNWFRFPGEFAGLVTLGLAVAAGMGAEALAMRTTRLRFRGWMLPAGLALAACSIRYTLPSLLSSGKQLSTVMMGIAVFALLAITSSSRLRWALVLGVVAIDLFSGFANPVVIPDTEPERYQLSPAVAEFVREHQGHQRTYLHVPAYQPPILKAGMLQKLYIVEDHESLVPSRYVEYAAWAENGSPPAALSPPQGGLLLTPQRKRMKLLDLLGVRFLVTFGPQTPFRDPAEAAQYRAVFRSEETSVFENSRASPRAFVVGEARMIESAATLARMSDDSFDASSVALVEDPLAVVSGGVARPAQIEIYEPERVVVHTSGATPGMLILTDQFYPGWRATLDGAAAPIYCADYIFRGVPVPSGTHTIEFTYAPRSLRLGAWITSLTLAAIAIAAATQRGYGRGRNNPKP